MSDRALAEGAAALHRLAPIKFAIFSGSVTAMRYRARYCLGTDDLGPMVRGPTSSDFLIHAHYSDLGSAIMVSAIRSGVAPPFDS